MNIDFMLNMRAYIIIQWAEFVDLNEFSPYGIRTWINLQSNYLIPIRIWNMCHIRLFALGHDETLISILNHKRSIIMGFYSSSWGEPNSIINFPVTLTETESPWLFEEEMRGRKKINIRDWDGRVEKKIKRKNKHVVST